MTKMYLAQTPDGKYVQMVNPMGRVIATANWQEAKFYPLDWLTDLDEMLKHGDISMVLEVDVTDPRPTGMNSSHPHYSSQPQEVGAPPIQHQQSKPFGGISRFHLK